MHKYTDPNKQAIVDKAAAAIKLADEIIAQMRARLQPRPEETPRQKWVKLSDMTPEERAKVIRMENKPR